MFHYTGMKTTAEALERLTSPHSGVSAHYLIGDDGSLYALVDEDRVAWHAGESHWRGRDSVNRFSIGIELANPGAEWGYKPFAPTQMATCIALAKELIARHRLDHRGILAHSDIAPRRKQDPGELFDWRLLAENQIGFYPRDLKPAAIAEMEGAGEGEVRALLTAIGFEVVDLRLSLVAFQRRWRPKRVDGDCDCETIALLRAVASAYGGRQTSR